MQVYKKVEIDPSANEDIDELFEFLIEGILKAKMITR